MRSYRRHLPHIDPGARPVFLTWRLADSFPQGRAFPETLTSGQAFAAMDQILDHAQSGSSHLRLPNIARLVVDALHYARDQMHYYELHAYVVMPNHVHLLITPRVELAKITHALKRFTARQANTLLNLTGLSFWQDESYDRVVRDAGEFERIRSYIEHNPVRAGLAVEAEAFPWSSAYAPTAPRGV